MHRPRLRGAAAAAVIAMAMTGPGSVLTTGTAAYSAAAHPAPVAASGDTFWD